MRSAGISGQIEILASLQARLLSPVLKRAGLSLTTFQLLSVISAGRGLLKQSELGEELGIAPATLSESIQEHVQKGLIVQEPSEVDKRARLVKLTALGEAKLKEVVPALKRLDALYDEPLGASEAESVAESLGKIISHLQTLDTA